jgi:cobyrinic acid a,c-diamide synthase
MYPMVGALDLIVEQTARPCGHGYALGTVDHPTAFFEPGTELRGHEFHYSRVIGGEDRENTALALARGAGIGDGRDAITAKRVWASYLHIHALATPAWAPGVTAAAHRRRRERETVGAAWA